MSVADDAMPALPSLRERRNLREDLAVTLRSAVIAGELAPGKIYSAPALAKQFGVSATPVREAMIDLVREGFFATMRNKGFRAIDQSDAGSGDFDDSVSSLPSFRERPNLREELTVTLRGAVISGELVPGQIYSAPALAKQFGVSATPVREAMLDLVREGLVDTMRNKGFRVTDLSDADLDNINDLRALIEVPTVRRITEGGVDPATIEKLRMLAAGIEDAAKRRDLIAHVTIDTDFHLTLLATTGNDPLVDTVRSLRSKSRIYGLRLLAERDELIPSSREHMELVDLIEAGDADGAEDLMRRHIGHVRGIWAASDSGTTTQPEP